MPSKLDFGRIVKLDGFKRYQASLEFEDANKILGFDSSDSHTRLHVMLDE